MENFIEYVMVCKKLNSQFITVNTATKDGTIDLNYIVGDLARTSNLMVKFKETSNGMIKTITNFNILHNIENLTIIESELRKSIELIESTKPQIELDILDDSHKKFYTKFCRIANEIYNEIDKDLITDKVVVEMLELPEIEITSQKDQIRLMYDLGLITALQTKFPNALKTNNQLANIIAKILKLERTSIVPTVNALMNNTFSDKNYPKESKKTQAIVDSLKSM